VNLMELSFYPTYRVDVFYSKVEENVRILSRRQHIFDDRGWSAAWAPIVRLG